MSGAYPARANPFRSARIEALRFRLDDRGWRLLLDRFEGLGRRGALVGPKGSGKTTLLEELEARLESEGWRIRRWRLRKERPSPSERQWRLLATSGPRDLVSVDGAEQLSWWRWHRLAAGSRRAGGLLITSHRKGLLPCLSEHRTSPELLKDLVADLVGPATAGRWDAELRRLFESHRGNVRECLRSLYDGWPAGGENRLSWRPLETGERFPTPIWAMSDRPVR